MLPRISLLAASDDNPPGVPVRARDLAQPCASISTRDPLALAADRLVEQRLSALLVVDAQGRPIAVVRAEQLIGACLPGYLAQDPLLVRVIDEPHADRLCVAPADRLVADCLPPGRPRQFSVAHDSTVLEVAELMARTGCPVVAVQERDAHGASRYAGAVTAFRLLAHLRQGTHA
ncbi:CBS domain-containing protein [Streptomyces sp. NPDC008313]|uniref:CBS domain-containing protein n=1 Tax=Streptomyces sp. NPDC008313 TaxID=3364826 RepID=UPI0036E3C721